ncbi:hypothetical protein [Bradyrhizobium sp. USDA 4350]
MNEPINSPTITGRVALTVLTVDIEISDQTGRDLTFVVGVFSNPEEIAKARALVESRITGQRLWFKEIPADLNSAIDPPRSGDLYTGGRIARRTGAQVAAGGGMTPEAEAVNMLTHAKVAIGEQLDRLAEHIGVPPRDAVFDDDRATTSPDGKRYLADDDFRKRILHRLQGAPRRFDARRSEMQRIYGTPAEFAALMHGNARRGWHSKEACEEAIRVYEAEWKTAT